MVTLEDIKEIVAQVLQLGEQIEDFDRASGLLGSVPEFDSMAVVTVIAALEENFDFIVDDDEISADIFETMGDLLDFVNEKAAA